MVSPPRTTAVHLDAAAERLHPAARDVLLAALDEGWADPLALHTAGRRARLLLDNAREVIAVLLDSRPDELSFTASGTAAVHSALLGTAEGRRRVGTTVVHSAVEHSSVLHAAGWLSRHGGTAVSVPVDRLGRVDTELYAAAVRAGGVAVACLQLANTEVGTVQPVESVARLCAEHGVPLLVDAAGAVGRVDVPGGWSLLSASARRWGGPAGVGVRLVRKGVRWREPGPADDRGFVNVAAAAAAAAALQAVSAERAEVAARQWQLVTRIREQVAATVPDVEVVGDPELRLPHVVTFSCLYVEGEALVGELDRRGFAVASGSACTASTLEPSHVLAAMGVTTHGNVRVSLPRDVTEADAEAFLAVLPGVVAGLRDRVGM